MNRQADINRRTLEYRVWTSGNSNSNTTNAVLCKSKTVLGENNIFDWNTSNIDVPGRPDEDYPLFENMMVKSFQSFMSLEAYTKRFPVAFPVNVLLANSFSVWWLCKKRYSF